MIYTMCFKSFHVLADKIVADFVCPQCKTEWHHEEAQIIPTNFNFNQKVVIKIADHNTPEGDPCPLSGDNIQLSVAVHNSPETGLMVCIQRSDIDPVPNDWWDGFGVDDQPTPT